MRMPINMYQEIQDAIQRLWAGRIKEREERDAAGRTDFRGEGGYITATDVEREVREHLQNMLDQPMSHSLLVPSRSRGRLRITGLNGHTLLGLCRDGLFALTRSGKWTCHNHGRGHISGMRFRPADEPLSTAEETSLSLTREEKIRRKFLHHFARPDGKAVCGAGDRKRSPYADRRGWKPKPETDASKVTCKVCLKLLATGQVQDRAKELEVAQQVREEMEPEVAAAERREWGNGNP
jgi:hypothetical protein